MESRLLGSTGIKVSPLSLGTLNFGNPTPRSESIQMVYKALEAGINLIDTADIYNLGESETIIGHALKNGRRERVILATKVHFPMSKDPNEQGNTRLYLRKAVDASLRRLQTDHIDLYQIHRPVFDVPQDETLRVLDDLVHQGKVCYIGSSTFPAWLIMEALAISERYGFIHYVTEQPPYNLFDRRIENEIVPLALRYNLGLLTWSPLASGLLAGRYSEIKKFAPDSRAGRIGSYVSERISDKGIELSQRFIEIARSRGLTPSQLALLWVKDQPAVTSAIIGSRTEIQLEDALQVLKMRLDPELVIELDKLVPPGSAVSNFYNNSGWMKMRLSW